MITPSSPALPDSIRPPRTRACRAPRHGRLRRRQDPLRRRVRSSKIGVFDTAALENNTFDPKTASTNYIPVSGGGPAGLALDSPRNRLYVLTRFDDAIKVIDLGSHQDIAQLAMLNPEPAAVVQGQPMLYDATRFSGNGEAACASCHIFGDMDDLAWDLGNPDNSVTANPTPINLGDVAAILLGKILFNFPGAINGTGNPNVFHPMKGADDDANLARA